MTICGNCIKEHGYDHDKVSQVHVVATDPLDGTTYWFGVCDKLRRLDGAVPNALRGEGEDRQRHVLRPRRIEQDRTARADVPQHAKRLRLHV